VSVPAAEVSKQNVGFIEKLILKIKHKASWSWLSIPSLLIAWVLIAIPFESYILPQPWEVIIDEGWDEQLFPQPNMIEDEAGNLVAVKIDDDGNEVPLTAAENMS